MTLYIRDLQKRITRKSCLNFEVVDEFYFCVQGSKWKWEEYYVKCSGSIWSWMYRNPFLLAHYTPFPLSYLFLEVWIGKQSCMSSNFYIMCHSFALCILEMQQLKTRNVVKSYCLHKLSNMTGDIYDCNIFYVYPGVFAL